MNCEDSLWGDDFVIPKEKEKTKKILEKIAKPKTEKAVVKRSVKSKEIDFDALIENIRKNVEEKLKKQKNNIVCVTDLNTLHKYIDQAILNGRIDIDTETNNSLDPITCKIMGLCLYTPGEKQIYVPINHRDHTTKERLSWQLTEQDVHNELERCFSARAKWVPEHRDQSYVEWYFKHIQKGYSEFGPLSIMHNGKFDYQVIYCTCNLKLPIDWDTMIGAKLLDENERSAGLKQQFISKIDPDQEKYDIESLFEGVLYEDVDPKLFTYYSATDALMTDKLFEYQIAKFTTLEMEKVFNLACRVEMPLVHVIGEMEMNGMEVDQEYSVLLSKKYHKQLDELDTKINKELTDLQPKIDAWRLTEEANVHPVKKGAVAIDGKTPTGKSKSEQLSNPINLGSPTQLAILFYDILKAPMVDKKQPRATGEDALKAIGEKLKLDICDLLLKRREIVKLLSTYIDTIPELAKRWPDGRVRTHFNQYGAATGRLSSSEPLNFQNIPSHNKEIRMLFKAKLIEEDIFESNNCFEVTDISEILTPNGYVHANKIKVGDQVYIDDAQNTAAIIDIKKAENKYLLYI